VGAEHLVELVEHALHVGVALGFEHQYLQAQRLEPLRDAGRLGQQHRIGPERDDGFHVGFDAAAHLRQGAHCRRRVGIVVHAHQPLAGAERADGFGERRQQRDDALRRLRQAHRGAAFVNHVQGVRGERAQRQPDGGGDRWNPAQLH
jgi:hypothetical protein